MLTYTWYQWILFFYIYCFIGWIIESTFVSVKKKHFVNRGFLRLPLLPIYGSGAVIMLWASLPFQGNVVLVFLSGMVGASVLEYVTGYVMERLFKMKYWDYSDNPFNLNGYICLGTSIAWGFLTIALTFFIHPKVTEAVLRLPVLADFIIVGIVSVLFIADSIESTKEALDLGKALEAMTKVKAELEEVQLQMSLLKMEATQKVSDLHGEAVQKAANIKDETTAKIADLKAANTLRHSDTVSALKEAAGKAKPDLTALSERLQALTERRENLSSHLGFYRKGLLRGNPTASSKQFGEALKELKEYSKRKKKD